MTEKKTIKPPENKKPGFQLTDELRKKLKNTIPVDEWAGVEPTKKDMGLVTLTLDKGVKTTLVGTVYGLDFEIEDDGYKVKLFFDYYNRRLKVLDYEAEEFSSMLRRLAYLAEANKFDKIFVKTTPQDFQNFLAHGYMMEGVLKYFFKGGDAYVLSRFSSKNRIMSDVLLEEAQLVEKIVYGSPGKEPKPLDPKIKIIKATKNHISDLVSIYRTTFETYPSPLTNPDYVKSSMDRDVIYRLAFYEDTAIAAASAEIDPKNANAEMTDCATIPEAQGQGIMQHLLVALEEDVKEMKLLSVYTLARAISYGMNCAFFRLGYEFSGRLINNCDIFGRFEDMNIWVKKL
jgi:putative beta-lysine N-acetyltransferase